jgi:hypothetical protein
MRIDRSDWRRKHDDPRRPPIVINPRNHFFPESREDLLEIVRRSLTEPQIPEVRASGSHWALSGAAVTNSFVVETRGFSEPDGVGATSFLNNPIYNVIPECLTETRLNELITQVERPYRTEEADLETFNYYHVESGMRIFELYSRLDSEVEGEMPTSRHQRTQNIGLLKGPWAMPTLGGAGGQTIVGAFSTGTHGGDQHQPPIADAVQAIHLIGSDGYEYWIERAHINQIPFALTDDKKLRRAYPNIRIIRDNEVFHAVLVSVGRMGIIYSVVLKVVRQYGLRQTRLKANWTQIAPRLANPSDSLFTNRFLQVVVVPHSQHANPMEHSCFVETRNAVGLAAVDTWQGRSQRAGTNAGRMSPIGDSGDFQSFLCNGNAGALVESILTPLNAAIWAIVFLFPPPFGIILALFLRTIADFVSRFIGFTGTVGELVVAMLNEAVREGLIPVIGLVNDALISAGQVDVDRTDISYAIMDGYDYATAGGCIPNADSLTVSFNADDMNFITFLNNSFNRLNELHAGTLTPPGGSPIGRPMSFGGYFSLRFTGRTEALIGMQQWIRTCNIEIAGIKTIEGTEPFLRVLEADALALGATIHWGQKNESTVTQVETAFSAGLDRWRNALSRFTANGRIMNFSTAFSRQKGLEVVQPVITSFRVIPTNICVGEIIAASWNAVDNPPGTSLSLQRTGAPSVDVYDREGTADILITRHGISEVTLLASNTPPGSSTRTARSTVNVTAYASGDRYRISGTATCMQIDGVSHWGLSVILNSEEWSSRLGCGNLYLISTSGPVVIRKQGVPDLTLPSRMLGIEFISPTIMAGEWMLFLTRPNCDGPAPVISIDINLRCL